jgi:hypothetical protein
VGMPEPSQPRRRCFFYGPFKTRFSNEELKEASGLAAPQTLGVCRGVTLTDRDESSLDVTVLVCVSYRRHELTDLKV